MNITETAGKKNHNRFGGTKNNTVMNSVIILPPMMGLIAMKNLSALKPLEMIMSYIVDLPLPVASERFENFKGYYWIRREIFVFPVLPPTPNPFCPVICPDPML